MDKSFGQLLIGAVLGAVAGRVREKALGAGGEVVDGEADEESFEC